MHKYILLYINICICVCVGLIIGNTVFNKSFREFLPCETKFEENVFINLGCGEFAFLHVMQGKLLYLSCNIQTRET